MNNTELKPCPFCGGPAILIRGGFGEIFASCADEKQCGGRLGTGVWFSKEHEAVRVWNERDWKKSCTDWMKG